MKGIKKSIMKNKNFTSIPLKEVDYVVGDELYSTIETIAKNLPYENLILRFIKEYHLSKKRISEFTYNRCVNLVNVLHMGYSTLNQILNVDECTIYECSLYFFNCLQTYKLLFPEKAIKKMTSIESELNDIIQFCIFRVIHYINKYYYIKSERFSYENTLKYSSYDKEMFKILLNCLTSESKIFIIKLGSYISYKQNYLIKDVNFEDIKKLADEIKSLKEFFVVPQTTNTKMRNLIKLNASGIQKYCEDNNLLIKNWIFDEDYDSFTNSKIFLEFTIVFNSYDYKFTLKKYNTRYSWNVRLKNDYDYKINLYLENDYEHIVQAMLNDGDETENEN